MKTYVKLKYQRGIKSEYFEIIFSAKSNFKTVRAKELTGSPGRKHGP